VANIPILSYPNPPPPVKIPSKLLKLMFVCNQIVQDKDLIPQNQSDKHREHLRLQYALIMCMYTILHVDEIRASLYNVQC